MARHGLACVLFALLAALALAAQAAAAEEVGAMAVVVNQVTGTPAGGAPTAMTEGDAVLLDMTLATGPASFAELALLEGAKLTLAADTQLTVDKAQIDAATGASESLLSLLVGKIRLVLSSVFRGDAEVDTSTATIGVKGTVFAVEASRAGDTTVWVEQGVVAVTSKAGGTVEVRAGYSTTVRRGAPPTDPAPFDPESGAAASRALPPDFTPPNEAVEPALPLEGQELPPRRDTRSGEPPPRLPPPER